MKKNMKTSLIKKYIAKTSLIVFFLVFSIVVIFPTQPVIAEEDEPSQATDQDNQDATNSATTQSLKERIEKVVEEKERKNGTVVGQTSYSTRAIIGLAERVSESAITIESHKGSVIIPINEKTELIKNDKTIKISEVEIGNSVIALGLQSSESFTPIKIIFGTKSLMPKPQLVQIGSVKSITATALNLESRKDTSSWEFTLNKTTSFLDAQNDEIKPSELFEDVQIIVIGYEERKQGSENKTNIAQIVKALVSLN